MIIEVDSRNCDESIEEIRKIPHLHTSTLSIGENMFYSIKELSNKPNLIFKAMLLNS